MPSDVEMLSYAALSFASRPVQFVKAANNLGRSVVRGVQRARERELDVPLPLTAPRLSMNRSITPHRKVAFESVPLADIKAAKNALGVTVNDVVLAVTAGALRNYLIGRDELPDRSLVAAIPTNVRAEGERELGNRVSAMFASLPVEIEDPLERVEAVATLDDGVEAGQRGRRHRDARGVGRRRRARGVLAGDPALRPAAARRAHAARDQPDRLERARAAVPALPRRRPARRAAPAGPDPRRLRLEPDRDVVPRPRRLRLHRVPRARARRRRARRPRSPTRSPRS